MYAADWTPTHATAETLVAGSLLRQGSDKISSQIYHDLSLGYRFGYRERLSGATGLRTRARGWLNDVTLQAGVKNVLNDLPPYDFFYEFNYYTSPYGDLRGRSYWVTLKKSF